MDRPKKLDHFFFIISRQQHELRFEQEPHKKAPLEVMPLLLLLSFFSFHGAHKVGLEGLLNGSPGAPPGPDAR